VLGTTAPAHAATVQVQILGTNDFHGRLISEGTSGTSVAGAAQFGGAIQQTRASFAGDSVFVAAGDLIGASTFESFIQKDKPTLDAFNTMRLDVSAAGNHEFDAGYDDLNNRVMAPYNATSNPYGGAKWPYLAANVRKKSDGSYALRSVTPDDANNHNGALPSNGGTWIAETPGGARIGFIGAVTEDLPSLVSPSGIASVNVTKIVTEVNAAADTLRPQVDMIVMLVHEGAATDSCATNMAADTAWGQIVRGVEAKVNAVVSGHTHLAYDCKSPVTSIPVVSAGQYGTNFNVLKFNVDTTANTASLTSSAIQSANQVTLSDPSAIAMRDTIKNTIVDPAVTQSDVLGAVELGKLGGGVRRAYLANGTTENRGGESTLGNLVAEVQRWATSTPEAGAAQIAFMNPGGLRQDMVGNNGAGYPATLTYKQAAVVQPFANTLVNMKMTGAQIKTVLEQQWQRDKDGNVPSRPFLRLGTSAGFLATYDATRPEGNRVTSMWLNGKAIEPATSYSVTVNSFLSSGGDNFREFAKGTAKRDTGKVDLQAMVDYMAAKAKTTPLPVDAKQHFVGVTRSATTPRFYRLGQDVKLSLSSLAMTAPGDLKDTLLNVKVGETALAPTPVDNTIGTAPFDDYGTSAVSVKLKGKTRTGKQLMSFTGPTTGTTFTLPIDVRKALGILKVRTRPERIVRDETRTRIKIKASALGISKVTGKVLVKAGGKKYVVKLKKGRAFVRLDSFAKTGKKKVVVKYVGSRKVRSVRGVLTLKVHRS
jgi:5'-nucleotidase